MKDVFFSIPLINKNVPAKLTGNLRSFDKAILEAWCIEYYEGTYRKVYEYSLADDA